MLSPRTKSRWLLLPVIPFVLMLFDGNVLSAPPDAQRPGRTTGGSAAEVIVHVPTDAIVWFDGVRMTQTGTERRFVTPPIPPGRRFSYDVRASWILGGRAVEQKRHVSFRAGERVVLDLAPAARSNPPQDILIDPAAPAPWRTSYYYDPFNWPNYPNLRPGRPFSPLPSPSPGRR